MKRDAQKLEHRALQISLAGTVVMAVMGIGFGLFLHSSAILLDGFFSFLSMGMTGLSLFTSYLIQRPEDKRFQFGYAHLEPLMNSVNGIVILVLCLYALTQGLSVLLAGGNELVFELALYYAVPMTIFCTLMWLYEHWIASQTGSELVRVDSKEWLVDAILSSTLALGFIGGLYLQDTEYADYARYIDSLLVVVLSAFAIIIPWRVLRESVGEVLLVASPKIDAKLRGIVRRELAPYHVRMIGSHVAKIGRRYDIEINILLDEKSELFEASLERLDDVRNQLSRALDLSPDEHWISISFTQDRDWL